MRFAGVGVLAAALLLALSPQAGARNRSPAVIDWVQVELKEIADHRTNPPRAARGLALLSVALLDATRAPPGHQDAALAGAAATVLAYLYPDRAAAFEELAEHEHPAKAVALGRSFAKRVVTRARRDGSDAVWYPTTRPTGPGLWVPTPPLFVQEPLEPLAGTWRTWNIASGSRFRPPPPPAFGSPSYMREVREVYDVSLSLTDEQRRIANFWADGAGTATPPGHWNRIAFDLIESRRMSGPAAARVLAALNTAQADAFIACWDAKYAYWSERPVTAIQRMFDESWNSYIVTPPFPSYVSGHSTTSAAAAAVLGVPFPEAARQLRAWAEEAATSRLYGGIHFRSDNQTGLDLGANVAAAAIARYL